MGGAASKLTSTLHKRGGGGGGGGTRAHEKKNRTAYINHDPKCGQHHSESITKSIFLSGIV